MTNKPKSNLCDIFEDCITIHPFRYGLIRTDDYTGFPKIKFPVPESHSKVQFPDYSFLPSVNEDNEKSSDQDDKEDDKNGNKISFYDPEEQIAAQHSTRVHKSVIDDARTFPSGYKYSYGATPLHEGWLYVYNETDDSVKEYQVVAPNANPLFRLCRINDIEKAPFRYPEKNSIWTKGINVDKDAVIFMEFSHIQWDPDIIDSVLKVEEVRNENIQKIDVNEWIAGNAQDGVFDYETAKSHYIPNPSDTVGFDFHYAYCQEDDSEIFACIHDRVGAANDLCNEITRLELLQESLIASVRTGVSADLALETLLLALLTAGMLYLAAYLTHSPLEEFYRNYIFNQKGLKKLLSKNQDADIIALMQLIHLKREDIIDDYFGQWRDYENILLEFESLYPAVLVESPQIVQSEKRMKLSWWQQAFMGLTTSESPAYFIEERADTITFNCHLLQITPNMDIDFGLLSYSSKEGKMVKFGEGLRKLFIDDKSFSARIVYDISKVYKSHFYNEGFFYIRIILDPIRNIYWPREHEKEPRYFFFNIGLKGIKPSIYLFNTTLTRNQDGNYIDYETKKNQWIMSIDEFKTLARINEEKTITKTNKQVYYVD